MTKQASRTPGPWIVGGQFKHDSSTTIMRQAGREPVAAALDFNKFDRDAEREANAAFIVRACNAHDDLVAALREIDRRLDFLQGIAVSHDMRAHIQALHKTLCAALKRAES